MLRNLYTGKFATNPQVFTASTFGIINARPCKVVRITIGYFLPATSAAPTAAVGMSFILHSATGEEVNVRGPLLPSASARTVTIRIPRGTDYGTYPANGPVLTVNNGAGVQFTFAVQMQYRNQPINVLA